MMVVLGACSSAQTPPPAPAPAPEPIVAPAPAPTPAPAPAPQHAEAHLNHGHITLEHQILFDTDSDHIQENESASVLNDIVALLRENTQVRRVRIEGHTDTRGDARRNQALSERRAAAVAAYLGAHGFASIQFEPVGFGATQPVCQENNDACHDRNRRVEFTITEPAPAN
ncbi:MAG: OmpA family protein [Myxococcales bacterium]|nr:OmpA family protein [Myxococcales bacterium]